MTTYGIESLRAAIAEGAQPKYLFFWGHTAHGRGLGKECLSQWYPSPFVVNGRVFPTAEHYMMFRKAVLFGDDACAERIVRASSPSAAKALGRAVQGFEESVWEAHRTDIVVQGSYEKFAQSAELKAFLLATGNQVLVEASPRDRIWGIGLAADDARARNPAEWRGLNLLGFALMTARDLLR